MVSSARQAIACILLIFGTVVYVQSQSAPDKGPTGSITGKITIKGKGVSGVAVTLLLVEPSTHYPTRHRGLTDDDGNYRIANVPPGKYVVRPAAPAFAPVGESSTQKTILLTKGETVDNVDFALGRGGVITGRVTDSDGRPLIEEEILISSVQEGPSSYFMRGHERTDDRGIYRIFGLPPGSYRVAAGQAEEDRFGSSWGRAGYRRTFHPDVTDASKATVIEVTEGGEVTNVDITLGRAIVRYFASGRIIDGDTGRPLANVPYGVQMFINQNSSGSRTTGVVSDSQGEFKLQNLAPGKYAVFVEPPPNSELRADSVRFEVIDQDVNDLIVKLSKGASASGVIVLEGTDDKNIYANLVKATLYPHVFNTSSDRSSSPSANINPDGSFRVGGLQAGLLNFGIFGVDRLKVVRLERDGVVYPKGIEIKEREQVKGLRLVVNYANGTIRGVVTLEKGTLPQDSHVNVSLKRLGEEVGPFTSSSSDSPQVDARGQFFAEGLLPGTYEVTASYAPDLRTPWRQTKQQVVVANGVVTNLTLTIDPNPPGRP